MTKNTMTVLTPDFYNEFACVAGGCRSNCCAHQWQVHISKKNYKQLRALREPKWLVNDFGKYFKRNDSSTSDSNYAMVVHNEQGCGFQTEDGLCRLHADLGAQYLSPTCRQYPRLATYLATPQCATLHREQSLTTSCEEVARMLLHKPEPIQFVTTYEEYSPEVAVSSRLTGTNMLWHDGTRTMLDHYSLVRAICIALLQNRDYTIEQRLILLVLYLDKLATAEDAGDTDSVPAITDTFVAAVDERLYDPAFAITPIPEVTAKLANFAAIYAFQPRVGSEVVTRCNAGFAVDYQQRTANYRKLAHGHQAFIEHLLVIELFGKVLPFKRGRTIRDCMQYLVSIFTIFRFMLGGYLGEQSTLTEVELVDFVAFYGKVVLHSANSFDVNAELLSINDMGSLAYLVASIVG